MRGIQNRAILWNIGILKVHFVHAHVCVHSKESMNAEFHKNNIQLQMRIVDYISYKCIPLLIY